MRVVGADNPEGELKGKVTITLKKFEVTSAGRSTLLSVRESIYVRTRKGVNYGWLDRSQWKHWWRFVAILTCKSFVKTDYRGERLIEPPSSWLPSKFLSG